MLLLFSIILTYDVSLPSVSYFPDPKTKKLKTNEYFEIDLSTIIKEKDMIHYITGIYLKEQNGKKMNSVIMEYFASSADSPSTTSPTGCPGVVTRKTEGLIRFTNKGEDELNIRLCVGVQSFDMDKYFAVFSTKYNDIFTVKTSDYINKVAGGCDIEIGASENFGYINVLNKYTSNSYTIQFASADFYGEKYETLNSEEKAFVRTSLSGSGYVQYFETRYYYNTSPGVYVKTSSDLGSLSAVQIYLRDTSTDSTEGERIIYTQDSNDIELFSDKNSPYNSYRMEKTDIGKPDDPPKKKSIGEIVGTVIGCYYGVMLICIILICLISCVYPNRLYRTGYSCICCYCCCLGQYVKSKAFYEENPYKMKCNCLCDNDEKDVYSCNICNCCCVYAFFTICIFVFAPFIALWLLINTCCSSSDEERDFERGIESHQNKAQKDSNKDAETAQQTQYPVNNSVPQQNMQPMQPMYQQPTYQQQPMYQQPTYQQQPMYQQPTYPAQDQALYVQPPMPPMQPMQPTQPYNDSKQNITNDENPYRDL